MKISIELAIIVANVALCATLAFRRVSQSYPHLFRYSWFQALAALGSLLAYLNMGIAAYSLTYYLLIFAGDILAIFAAAEIAAKLLGPQGVMPAWVNNRLVLVLGVGVAAGLGVAILLLMSSYGQQWGRAAVTVEHWMAAIVWVTFSAIFVFWRTLKVFRRQTRAASICLGFVLYFTVSIFTVFIRGHRAFVGESEAAGIAGMISYLVMLLWWTGVFLMPAPVFEKATAEQTEYVLGEFQQTLRAATRAAIVP